MNPLRDSLLQRHAAANPRLDAIRHGVVAGLRSRPSTQAAPRPWWNLVWQELILPARTAWSGLAALALVALGLQLATPDLAPGGRSPSRPAAPNPALALRERLDLLADLDPSLRVPAAPTPPPPTQPGAATPGQRRSALTQTNAVA